AQGCRALQLLADRYNLFFRPKKTIVPVCSAGLCAERHKLLIVASCRGLFWAKIGFSVTFVWIISQPVRNPAGLSFLGPRDDLQSRYAGIQQERRTGFSPGVSAKKVNAVTEKSSFCFDNTTPCHSQQVSLLHDPKKGR